MTESTSFNPVKNAPFGLAGLLCMIMITLSAYWYIEHQQRHYEVKIVGTVDDIEVYEFEANRKLAEINPS